MWDEQTISFFLLIAGRNDEANFLFGKIVLASLSN
jgi:hypothetical protein